MKKIFTLIILTFGVFANSKAHVQGARIEYVCLGNSKYEITLTAYRDCNSAQLSNTPINAKCISGMGSKTLSLTQISSKDVTGLGPNCTTKSPCISGGKYDFGVEEHVYVGVIDLSTLQCCEVIISWEQCCRIQKLTTTAPGNNFYIEALINKCVKSSMQWAIMPPTFVLSIGKFQNINFSATDSFDFDSISYALINPLAAAGTKISYKGSFSTQTPITYLGFPYVGGGFSAPAGFHFDPERGNLSFRPTKLNEKATIAVEATEWRNIGGIITMVGKIQCDIALIVNNTSRTKYIPIQQTTNVFAACEGDTSIAIIDFTDDNKTDSFTVNLQHSFKWATASLYGNYPMQKIIVRYIADTIPPQGINNAFTIELLDNDCPLMGRSVKTYSIKKAQGSFTDSSAIVHNKTCLGARFKVINLPTGTGFNYSWLLTSKNETTKLNGDSAELSVKDTGWIKAKLIITSDNHCNFAAHTDSVYIAPGDRFTVDGGKWDTVCNNNTATLTATVTNGTAPYQYVWSTGDSSATTTFTPLVGVVKYTVLATDAKGCVATHFANVINYAPRITLAADTFVCKNTTTTIGASLSDTTGYQWAKWDGYSQKTFTITEKITGPTYFTFTVNDGGCILKDSIFINTEGPQIKIVHDSAVCIGDTTTLTANPYDGKAPYNIYWLSLGKYGNTVNVSTANAIAGYNYFWVIATDARQCIIRQIDSIKFNPPPTITLQTITPLCDNGTPLSLLPFASPADGNWAGAAITNSEFNPLLSGAGTFKASYNVTDANSGCTNTAATNITVIRQPVASFTVDSVAAHPTHLFRFTNTSVYNDNDKFEWDFGDPNSGIYNNEYIMAPTHIFSDTGWYTIKLTLPQTVCNTSTVVKTNYIHVYDDAKPNGLQTITGLEFKLYPNPAKSTVTLETDFIIKQIKITDIIGRVFTVPVLYNNTKATINLESLEAGSYIINAESIEGKTITSPVIINR